MRILLIDDEQSLRRTLRTALESMGHTLSEAGSGEAALRLLGEGAYDAAFLDLRLGGESGLELLPKLLAQQPGLGIVVMTAYASIGSAVEAMRLGAFDYLPKPFTPDQLRIALEQLSTVRGLQRQVRELEEQVRRQVPEADLQTQEPAFQTALDQAFRVAPTEATVLLRGESGTGKGVLARAIHSRSGRSRGPFVTIHCPSLSAELLESELFGHAKGAFTGAAEAREGKVASAEGGTLFLDEIGDLPLALQPKLLRFLQDKEYERVGETRTRTGDVRFIAATNRPLEAEVKAGRFREDLFYRLNVFEVFLPPLRERPKDLLPLAEGLLAFFSRQSGGRVLRFSPAAREALRRHDWPGNLRELRNAIERGVILAKGPEVDLAHLPVALTRDASPPSGAVQVGAKAPLEALETAHVRQVVAACGSLEEAAAILGIDPSTLYRKRKRYGI